MIGMVPVSYGVEAGGRPLPYPRRVGASISNAKSRLASLFRGGWSADAQLVVGGHLGGRDGHDVGIDDPLAVSHPAPFVLKQHGVTGPVCVVPVGVVGAQVIEAPSVLSAVQGGGSRHIGAVENGVQLRRPVQFVRVA